MMLYSPLDQFEVSNLVSLNAPVLGYTTFALTNFGLYIIITVAIVLGFHVYTNNNGHLVPNKWSVVQEVLFASILSLVRTQVGQSQQKYVPFIYSLFVFSLISNLNGNVPYGFTTTTSIVFALGFSIAIFLGVTLLGLSIHSFKFFSFFVPTGAPSALIPVLVPIEIISYVARAFSLGVRLFANIVSGHSLLSILSGFLSPMFSSGILIGLIAIVPFTIFVGIVALEVAVSFIQAFVLCLLTASYIKDVVFLH